jgi:archaeosine-15-forming tRNA-guanine transglycosylase
LGFDYDTRVWQFLTFEISNETPQDNILIVDNQHWMIAFGDILQRLKDIRVIAEGVAGGCGTVMT